MTTRVIIGTAAAVEAEFSVRGRDAFTVVEMYDGEVVGITYHASVEDAVTGATNYGFERKQLEFYGVRP